MIGFAVSWTFIFFNFVYRFCLFVKELNWALLVIGILCFLLHYPEFSALACWAILDRYTVAQPVLRVMYCIVKKDVGRFWSKATIFYVLKYLLIISIQQKSAASWAWELVTGFSFVLGPYSPQFKEVCIQNGHSEWLFVNGQTIFFVILLTALLRELTVPRMLFVSWLRTHKVRHQVMISACVNVHASIYCTSNQFCSTWLQNPSKPEEEVCLENTVWINFCTF